MRRLFILVYSFLCFQFLSASSNTEPKIRYFNLQDVELLDSPFKNAQQLDKQYLLELDANRLLAPFQREAGLPATDSYTNWESTGLDGHIGGHYLSALSLMYASTGDEQIKERLDYMLNELKVCQDANGNGYIGGVPGGKAIWDEVTEGNIKAGNFNLNGKWVPLYNIHKTYAGLRDAYLYAHSEQAKNMLVKMTDWAIKLVANLSEEQIQDMLRSEHGGLNETFADVAAITGDDKYLELANKFSHKLILNPLLKHEDKLTGLHANTQIPKVIGFKRIADLEKNDSWNEAAQYFWENVVEHRSVCIGGNSVGEHFNPVHDFSRMINHTEGPETCNTYNMLILTKMLYQTSGDKKYMDYYERGLYNHILSTQNPNTGGLVYFTQMRPGHYRVYSQPHTSFWCCVGSGMENHAKYGGMIYAHGKDELYVNLFIPSKLDWKEKNIEVIQENNFPDEAKTQITVNPKKSQKFALKLRYPNWVKQGELRLTVNGKNEAVNIDENGYISVSRKWKKGDKIAIDMPMHVTVEQLPDKSNYYSVLYGPIVLAAKIQNGELKDLFADDSRGGHIARGRQIPMKDIPIIASEPKDIPSLIKPIDGKPMTFTISNLFSENYPKQMVLMPFFRIHESRYIIYWPQASANEVEALKKAIEEKERNKILLDAITIDKVVCGEQQPESDHFIEMDNSSTGFIDDVHWREAKGWFSYQLKDEVKKAKKLHISYFDKDRDRNFEILINGSVVQQMAMSGDKKDVLQTIIISVPEAEYTKDILEVKFVAKSNSITTKISEIRLLTE
ncbi:glycosyl hydrolase [Dysgonomonas sp. 216]|uniref:glycoside hydrolase family 127 protein n=1 Tax=Dysgonomonas sp. 216 TaxID=2302934 RepID=UPI0013D22C9A|nr:glycoside hydrolase family 127 protein [Dysgonomonas sp. 216]NDW19694.1 glycosyl hydrolase [Dysgonomonas sp. 216]